MSQGHISNMGRPARPMFGIQVMNAAASRVILEQQGEGTAGKPHHSRASGNFSITSQFICKDNEGTLRPPELSSGDETTTHSASFCVKGETKGIFHFLFGEMKQPLPLVFRFCLRQWNPLSCWCENLLGTVNWEKSRTVFRDFNSVFNIAFFSF